MFIFSDLSNVMSNVGEHVNKLVNEFLSSHGFQARDEAQQKLLVGQITEMQSNDNRVYKLLCKFQVHHDSVAEELKLVDYTVYNFFFHSMFLLSVYTSKLFYPILNPPRNF